MTVFELGEIGFFKDGDPQLDPQNIQTTVSKHKMLKFTFISPNEHVKLQNSSKKLQKFMD